MPRQLYLIALTISPCRIDHSARVIPQPQQGLPVIIRKIHSDGVEVSSVSGRSGTISNPSVIRASSASSSRPYSQALLLNKLAAQFPKTGIFQNLPCETLTIPRIESIPDATTASQKIHEKIPRHTWKPPYPYLPQAMLLNTPEIIIKIVCRIARNNPCLAW